MDTLISYIVDELSYSAVPVISREDESLADGFAIIGFRWSEELRQFMLHLSERFHEYKFTRALFTPAQNGIELLVIRPDLAGLLRQNEARVDYANELLFESGALYIEGICVL